MNAIVNAQLSEFANFQQTLYDLEKNHQRIKSQYVLSTTGKKGGGGGILKKKKINA